MKKRILSILLTLCMTLCLTPISVFAEEVGAEGSAAIQLGTDALSVLSKNVNTATAPTVYFGQNHENNPAAWRVIGYDGSGVTSSQGDITLLAAGAMGVIPFADTILMGLPSATLAWYKQPPAMRVCIKSYTKKSPIVLQ